MHRMQNLNEVSARYTELPNEFYIPTKWRKQDVKNKQSSNVEDNWDSPNGKILGDDGKVAVELTGSLNSCFTESLERRCKEAYSTYQMMIKTGVAREMARMVLPVNIYTEIYTCWDVKNLLHFVTLREDSHAQAEIQEYGRAVKTIMQDKFPLVMEAFDKYKWSLNADS